MREVLANESLVRRIERINIFLLIGMTLAAAAFFSMRMAAGVLLGAVVSTLSFQALKRQLRRAFQTPDRPPSKGGLFAGYYARFLVTVFVVFTVIYYGWVHPIAFLVGLSVVVLSIVMVGVHEFGLILFRREGR